MEKNEQYLRIYGYSIRDDTVGISSIEFEINTGLYPEDVDKDTREFIIKTIIRDLWEVHDNGDMKFEFSDEWEKISPDERWDFRRIMNSKISERILKEK